ncbi:hypothetical protein RvY_17478 [Ramazzottius varieornatus]|uniref:Bax inhibitor 1 n=1 Tax=Ramazzottius varieornatus TaxID=947166 RepID=A0A1D1W4F8_RAMVA|nr:hypothetical protein RvY_17478 [Ramazzottius varieornatus]
MDFLRRDVRSENSAGFNLKGLLDFSALEKPVQEHLTRVYGALAMALMVCSTTSFMVMQGIIPEAFCGLLSMIGMIGMTIYLVSMPVTPQNQDKRMAVFMGVAALMGMMMGPLLEVVARINPALIFTAAMITATIFTCFTLASLLSGNQRQFIYLGGTLSSLLMVNAVVRLYQIFTGSQMAFDISIYIGLVAVCGFVLYDTQMIVLKRRHGDTDHIKHALDLFIDAVSMFKHILVLLASKENNRNTSERKRKN